MLKNLIVERKITNLDTKLETVETSMFIFIFYTHNDMI